jgi:seryl-tRNA synthetase
MHDIKLIRDDPGSFDEGLKRRGLAPLSGEALKHDTELRALLTRLQTAQARRNEASKLIGLAKAKKDEAQAQALMAELAGLKDEIQEGEVLERKLQDVLEDFLAGIPNIPASDVPTGADETANVELRRFGTMPTLDFKPKEHFDLGEKLGQMDFEASSRISGARFVVLKKGLARLERAIAQFMLDLHTEQARENNIKEKIEIGGYTEVSPPYLVRTPTMFGTGQLPKFFDDQFVAFPGFEKLDRYAKDFARSIAASLLNQHPGLNGNDPEAHDKIDRVIDTHDPTRTRRALDELRDAFWLVPTAEVPLTNLVRGQILDEKRLPFRFTAYTPCFRAEAGAAGRDTRGMIRMHQFSKVELVSITTPERSEAEHERMTNCAQEVLKRLNMHHRVIVLSSGDMGFGAKKTYDIEVWLPGQNAFREISSCSNCGDFQARRMNARYRPEKEKQTRFVHTLNGSGLAVGRTLVAILENYQQRDGSIVVPDALKPYMGGVERIDP